MKFTIEEKANGEMAVRKMSEAARIAYAEVDPMKVYEKDGKLYIRSALGDFDDLSFGEADKELSNLCIEYELGGNRW